MQTRFKLKSKFCYIYNNNINISNRIKKNRIMEQYNNVVIFRKELLTHLCVTFVIVHT